MTDTRYYLLSLDENEPGARPGGLLRQRFDEAGVQHSQALGRDGEWAYTSHFLSTARGDQTFDEVEVDAEGAAAFERYLREQLGLPREFSPE